MDRQYVGIDFHRRRSVIVRLSAEGEKLGVHHVVNDPVDIAAVLAEAGDAPAVVIEATCGWYWVVDLLQSLGAEVHLANTHALELTRLLGHPILGREALEEGDPDGSSAEVPGGVPS